MTNHTTLQVLTVFEFAESVSRMREAQKHYADIQSLQAQRTMIALESEVDGILQHLSGSSVLPAFHEFAATVLILRREQNTARLNKSMESAARLLKIETGIDQVLAGLVREARELNAQLVHQ